MPVPTTSVKSMNLSYDDDPILSRFNVAFSWDYPDDLCLKNVSDSVFRVINDEEKERYVFHCYPLRHFIQYLKT